MSGQWFYSKGGEARFGPFTAEELKGLATAGELRPEDKVWKEGKRKWVSARKVQRLFDGAVSPAATLGSPAADGAATVVAARPAISTGTRGAGSAPAIPLPASARLEKMWLTWRASRGRRGAPASESLAYLAGLNEQLELTDQLLVMNTKVAAGTNPLLGEIGRGLNELGFTLEGAVEWLARQEKLHADYYDSLRRHKGMRDLLGLVTRFQGMTDGLYDVFSRAYGARLLVETLEQHRFSSRELVDACDRDVFNKQLAWAGEAIRKLPRESHADIENFRKAYATYHWLKSCDPEAELRKLRHDDPGPVRVSVAAPALPSRGLGTFWVLFACTMFWSSLLLMVCVRGAADNEPPPLGYFYFVLVLDAFPTTITLGVFLVVYRKYRRLIAKYATDREEYQRQRSKAIKEAKLLHDQVQAHNAAIDKLIPAIRQEHQESLAGLRQLINEFMVAHPQLSTFVNPV